MPGCQFQFRKKAKRPYIAKLPAAGWIESKAINLSIFDYCEFLEIAHGKIKMVIS
jgi:hypothetical protein